MQDNRVSAPAIQVAEELNGRLSWQMQLRWFSSIGILEVRLRWIAAIGVLAVTWVASSLLQIPLPTGPLYAIGACMLLYNALLRLYLDRRFAYPRRASGYDYESLLRFYWRGLEQEGPAEASSFDRFLKAQTSLDWMAMILLVHFSGGLTSPLLFYFVLHLLVASILFTRRACYILATVAAVTVTALALLEYGGFIPYVSLGFGSEALYSNILYVIGVLFFFTTSLYVAVYLTTTLTRDLRKREQELLRLQQQLSGAYQIIQTLYDVAKTVSSTLHLEEVLNLITQSAAEAMRVRACAIILVGEDSLQVNTISAYGLSEQYLDKGPIDVKQNRFITQPLSSGQPILVQNVSREEQLQYPNEMRAEGIVSLMCVPLMIQNRAEGVVCVYSDEPGQFIEEDARFLSALASAGATAIENARAYEALRLADQAKSDFVRMVTHEFRSPLSAVQSMLRLLDMGIVGPLTGKQRDLVERSQRRIAQLLAVVGDLLELASGKMEILQGKKKKVNLGEIVVRVTDLIRAEAEEKGITFEVELDGESLAMQGFEDGLERVILNLVSNAVKYTPPGGSVTVKTWAEEAQIRLVVSDTGIGIPEEALPRIFTEFYRAKNAKAMEVEGTGLGLVIAQDVVEQHGGQIAVQSVVGQGSTFSVSLPKD